MPAPTGRSERREQDEDELDELPPLDGDVRDEQTPEVEPGDVDEDEGSPAGLDDSTGEDDPLDTSELDLGEGETGWLEEPADAPDLDLGDVAVVEFAKEGSALDDAEEPPSRDEDFEFGHAPERGDLDAGDEGPLGADEELREADLPELDADAEGELDDAALVDAGFAADEPVGLPWAAEPWSRVGAPVALVAATAVACAGRGALASGRAEGGGAEMVRVDLEGTTQVVVTTGIDAARVRSLAVEGDRVAAIVQGGRILISGDGGASYVPLAPDVEGIVAAEAAWAGGALWVRTRAGGLLVVRPGEAAIERCAVAGTVVALAKDGDRAIAAMVADEAGRVSSLIRYTPGGGPPERERVDGPEARSLSPVFAVRGTLAAFAGRRGVAWCRADGSWATHTWEGTITALAFVDDAGTLIAATYSESDDTTALVRLQTGIEADVATATRASVVARIGPSPSDEASLARRAETDADGEAGGPGEHGDGDGGDGRVLALAYDDARGVVWVAGGFGVAAYAVR